MIRSNSDIEINSWKSDIEYYTNLVDLLKRINPNGSAAEAIRVRLKVVRDRYPSHVKFPE